jgi:hypothetical protein
MMIWKMGLFRERTSLIQNPQPAIDLFCRFGYFDPLARLFDAQER